MRVLFLSEQLPYPLYDGGNLRTYHLLRALALRHDVTLVSHLADVSAHAAADHLGAFCRVVAVPAPRVAARLAGNAIRIGVLKPPLFILKNRSQSLYDAAARLLDTEHFDVVHFNHLDTACYALERRWTQKLVFDTHNCLSVLASQFDGQSAGRFRAALFAREARLLLMYEAAVSALMDATLACSDNDAKAFQALHNSGNYHVVQNGVDTTYFRPGDQEEEKPGELVFTGAMGYRPNEEAALHFCRDILPILRERGRDARVTFVGRGPSARVQSLDDGTTIRVTGEVEDVRPYVRRAQVVVVPLRHGSGTRLKILEAFAMGKAVVSTPVGAEGIPAVPGEEIVLADDARSFADALADLFDDPVRRQRIGRAAARLARERFDWNAIGRQLIGIYDSLVPEHVAAGTQ